MQSFKEGFGKRLRELRKNRNFTQERLAELVELTPRQLTRIETGENFPSSDTIARISIALEVDLPCLFDFGWNEIVTLAANGTTDKPYVRLLQKNDVIDIKPFLKNNKPKEMKIPKQITVSESEISMLEMAKKVNKPITVEHFCDGERANIKIYYPNGTIETLISEKDIASDKVYDEALNFLKRYKNNPAAMEYILTAMKTLDDVNEIHGFISMIKGLELAHNMNRKK